jgi:hypothetical protein
LEVIRLIPSQEGRGRIDVVVQDCPAKRAGMSTTLTKCPHDRINCAAFYFPLMSISLQSGRRTWGAYGRGV